MPEFKNILLREHKGVRGGELKDLGKINVVCGSNNSGKTSVLECISQEKFRYRGITFGEEQLMPFMESYLEGRSWTEPRFKNAFIDSLRSALSKQPIWYDYLGRHLFEETAKLFRKTGSDLQRADSFDRTFSARFGDQPTVAFVPAKRRLDFSVTVASSEQVVPDGRGILNWLFFARNSPDDSEEQKKLRAIHDLFLKVSGNYQFDVFMEGGNTIRLRFRKSGGGWLSADDCGLGFRDLLVILYFGLAAKEDVILLEEPESHLHPEMQRRLIRLLRESSTKQFFLSTHSNVFLSTEFADRVFCCRLNDTVVIENATSRAAALTELGYSIAENLVSDLLILCEGPKDKPVLEELLAQRGLAEKYRVKIWPLGGDIMSQVDLSVFQERNQIMALIDADPKSDRVRKDFVKQCDEKKIVVHRLERYALENYFTLTAIAKAMSKEIPAELKTLAPDKKVSEQIGFEVKNNGRAILREMNREDIRGTDLEKFIDAVETTLSKGSLK